MIRDVLDAVADVIQVDDDMEIYTSGATNIFKYPELSDKQSAQEIISAFEEKQQLTDLVTQTLSNEENTGIQVYIGDEAPVKTMKDCSVVTATYELGDGCKGNDRYYRTETNGLRECVKVNESVSRVSWIRCFIKRNRKVELILVEDKEKKSQEDMVKEAVEEAKKEAEASKDEAEEAKTEEVSEEQEAGTERSDRRKSFKRILRQEG